MLSQKRCKGARKLAPIFTDTRRTPTLPFPPSSPPPLAVAGGDNDSQKTPYSNTGSKCQESLDVLQNPLECWVDFFQGTAHFTDIKRFHECVEFIAHMRHNIPIEYEPGRPIFAGIVWENSVYSLTGLKVGYNIGEDGAVYAWFSIPGGYFHLLDGLDHWRLLRGLYYAYDVKCNRIDWKVRDFTRRITPAEVYDLAVAGSVARVRTYDIAGNGKIGERPCLTTYLGSRQSEKFLRIYDAMPVHNISAIDWELQCRDEKAQVSYMQFVGIECIDEQGNYDSTTTYDLVSKYIGGVVCGSVDFVFRQDGVRLSRCPRLEWWEQFCDECGGVIRLSCGREPVSLQRTLQWLEKQVLVTISALRDGFGNTDFMNWLKCRLDAMPHRYRKHHESIIYMCRNLVDLEVVCNG